MLWAQVVFLAPPVLPRAPPPTLNGQPIVTLSGEVAVLRRAPPPTINGLPVAMIGHTGDTEVTVAPADGSGLLGGNGGVGSAAVSGGGASHAPSSGGLDLKAKIGRLFSKKRS